MASSNLPSWCKDFEHVFWSEHCVILSNSPNSVIPPDGCGLDIEDGQPFHLSLLQGRLWGRDDFWYLAFLPRRVEFLHDPLFRPLSIPFGLLPIKQVSAGQWRLDPNLVDIWLTLEWHVVATYNILKRSFGGLIPLRTILPPYPRSTSFHKTHTTEDEARRAAHRARRYFSPWLCLVTMCIAKSPPASESGPSEWFRVLADFRPALEPFWLDNIAISPVLTCLDHGMPRRGLVVNMVGNWSFLQGFPFLHHTSMPMWLCFPHEASFPSGLARSLKPSNEAIEKARNRWDTIRIDDLDSLPPSGKDVLDHERQSPTPTPPSRLSSPDPSHGDPVELDDDPPLGPIDTGSILDLTSQPFDHSVEPEKVAELDHLTFSNDLIDGFLDILKFRYGIVLPLSPTGPSSTIVHGKPHSKPILDCLRGMVQERVLDFPDWQDPVVIATLERFGSIILEGGTVPPEISDCHLRDEPFSASNDVWKLEPYQIRTSEAGPPLYAFRTPDGKALGWVIAVKSLVSAREVLRRRWGPFHIDLIRPLLDRGVPTLLGCLTAPRIVAAPASHVPNIFRPEGYVFQLDDYRSYVRRRLNLFKDRAVAQPAVREGGILWRLAMESEVDMDACLSVDHDHEAYQLTTVELRDTQWSVTVLPDAIADTLIGMYKVYTGEFINYNILKNTGTMSNAHYR